MSTKYVLTIKTNNSFLKNKYKQFLNQELNSLELVCPKLITVNGTTTIDFEIYCKMINLENPSTPEALVIVPKEDAIKEPLKVEHMVGFVDPSCDMNLMYIVTKDKKHKEEVNIKQGEQLFILKHPTDAKFTIKFESWLTLSNLCCFNFWKKTCKNKGEDDDDDNIY